ncbi:MAG: ABC transporter substrate-binding protein [Planctomycetota bacterium]|nr:MAG: ABC transporter substrate-binding protein [Planctomycetota bacterium]
MKTTPLAYGLALALSCASLAWADEDATGWQTSTDYPLIGDPAAKRDSKKTLRIVWRTFPPTLRTDGPNSNLVQTSTIHSLLYESLVQIHPNTEEFIPYLADRWKIETNEEEGYQTFTFHINEKARWSDGAPVTAEDVVKSFWHRVQEDRNDPSNVLTFSKGFHMPEAVDEHTVRVRTKELNWRLFLYFGGMQIYPAKFIGVDGPTYLEKYNWEFMPGSGPYRMTELKKGDSLVIERRDDWWAENERFAQYLYNFRRIKFLVVRDQELEFEMFKKGELDHYLVSRAQRWVVELPKEDIIQKGWVQRRKVYNQAPQGFSGFAFNMRKWPFNDRRVRLAFAHLFNRELLMEKLFFNEYEYINSYYPGRDWGNGANQERVKFDPDAAAELLDEAGFTEEDEDGVLMDSQGRRLEFTLEFYPQAWERIWLVVKKDYEENGIKLNLKLVDGATLIKKVSDRQFTLHYQAWGALLFPNPETSWSSELADKKANNNITGFKNARVDELCKRYNRTFDRAEQKKIVREIDKIVYNEHPYALGWYANFIRVLYWNRFGHPKTYFTRIGQVLNDEIILRWWYDEEKERTLEAAMQKGEALPVGEVVQKPWENR